MKLQVRFTVDIDWVDGKLRDKLPDAELSGRIESAVGEAVASALWDANVKGFDHEMNNEIKILADSEILVEMLD